MIPKVRPWLCRYWRGQELIREVVEHAPTRVLAMLNLPMRWKVEALQMNADRFTISPLSQKRITTLKLQRVET